MPAKDKKTFLVLGGGPVAMISIEELLRRSDAGEGDYQVVWATGQLGSQGGASESGGLVMPFCCPDPNVPRWTARSAQWWRGLRDEQPDLAPSIEDTPTIFVSHTASPPVPVGHLGKARPVDPKAYGFYNQTSATLLNDGIVVNTTKILQSWPQRLREHPRVAVKVLPGPVTGPAGAARLARLHGVDATIVCIGLGALGWGDTEMEGRFGWLLRTRPGAVKPTASDLAATHTLMYGDPGLECSYSIPRRTPGNEHLVIGGMVATWADIPMHEVVRPRPGSAVLAELDDRARRAAAVGLERANDELPPLRPYLQRSDQLDLWYSFRPYRSSVYRSKLDTRISLDQPMWMLHGMGGSGWTITPAVVEEVLADVLSDGSESATKLRSL